MNVTPRRLTAFKLSLLASLGIAPLACGGTTNNDPDETTAGSGGSTSGGSTSGGSASGGSGGITRAGSGGTNNQGGSPAVPTICTNPQANPLTGLVNCDEGYQHRPKAVECLFTAKKAFPSGGSSSIGSEQPRADGTEPCAGEPTICDQYAYGYCASNTVCLSGCVNDFDCQTGEICLCDHASSSPTGGSCRKSACSVDAECGPGMLCATFETRAGAYGPANPLLACQSAADACASSADCGAEQACEWSSTDQYRSCQDPCPACGRPFLVEATPRLAKAAARADWSLRQAPSVAHLSVTERATQAAHWTHLGQMEHASIAAFARFSLQLLSLGAPAELVEACTRALADETAHTQLCFGIASAYAGSAIGPGPLDITGSLQVTSLEDIVELVIAEGCFGETSAALEALEAADSAADPVIRAAYAQIAVDEQRHAELAFRFVRWALDRDAAAVSDRIRAALAANAAPSRAVQLVVEPCLQALLTVARAA